MSEQNEGRGNDEPISFGYTNWRGEYAERRAIPLRLERKESEWHGPGLHWVMVAFDVEKQAERDFLLTDMGTRASSRGEPVAWQRKLRKRGSPDWSDWKECTKKQAEYADAYGHPEDFEEVEAIARPLYASPAEAVVTDAMTPEQRISLLYKFGGTSEWSKGYNSALDAARAALTASQPLLRDREITEEAETDLKWRDMALQFDGHRIEALSMLRYAVSSIEEYATVRDILREPLTSIKTFLSKPPLPGSEVMAKRLAALHQGGK